MKGLLFVILTPVLSVEGLLFVILTRPFCGGFICYIDPCPFCRRFINCFNDLCLFCGVFIVILTSVLSVEGLSFVIHVLTSALFVEG